MRSIPFNSFSAAASPDLQSHSASKIFQKIPNFLKLYPDREFWSGWRSNRSVGPMTEAVVKNYLKKQDITQKKLSEFN